MKPAVAYYRLTSSRGPLRPLKPHAEVVERYAREQKLEVIETYVARESTERKEGWRVLGQAARSAKGHGATLLIANVGRLYLSAEYMTAVVSASPDMVALDNLGLFANQPAEQSSGEFDVILTDPPFRLLERAVEFRNKCAHNIHEAMQELKAEGRKFGTPNLTQEDRVKGAFGAGKRAMELAASYYESVYPLLRQLKGEGKSLRDIADELNARGCVTRYGKPYNPMTVRNLLLRDAGPGSEHSSAERFDTLPPSGHTDTSP